MNTSSQYRMSAEELVALSQKMDVYYQKKRGVTLAERAREYAEEKSGKTNGATLSGQKRRKPSRER